MGLTYFFSLTVCEVADISRRAHPQPFGDPFSGYRPFPPPPPQRPTAPAFGARTCPAPYTHLVVVAGILPAVEPGGKTPLLDEVPRLRDRPIQTPARFNLFNLLTLQPLNPFNRPAPRPAPQAPRLAFPLLSPIRTTDASPSPASPAFGEKRPFPKKTPLGQPAVTSAATMDGRYFAVLAGDAATERARGAGCGKCNSLRCAVPGGNSSPTCGRGC